MPRYLFPDGEIQTLSRRAAADIVSVLPLQEVDATGQPVLPAASALAATIEHLRAHEQVSLIQAALDDARARVRELEALLREADATLQTETVAATASAAQAAEDAARAFANEASAEELPTATARTTSIKRAGTTKDTVSGLPS